MKGHKQQNPAATRTARLVMACGVALSGVFASSHAHAAAGVLVFSPASVNFGDRAIGVASPDVTVTVTNPTADYVALTLPSVVSAGGSYVIDNNDCASLGPGQPSCSMGLYFTPQRYGPLAGSITFTEPSGGTDVLRLRGTGVSAPPIVQVGGSLFGGLGAPTTGGAGGPDQPGSVQGMTTPALAAPTDIVSASDGNLWYGVGNGVAFVNPATGQQNIFTTNDNNMVYELAAGHGPQAGAVWFTEGSKLGSIATGDGAITDYTIPPVSGAPTGSQGGFEGVLVDSAGLVWIAESTANAIASFDPAANNGAGKWTTYRVPTPSSSPTDLSLDSAGNLWFSEAASGKLGELSPAASVRFHEFTLPAGTHNITNSEPLGVFVDPLGIVWVADAAGNRIESFQASASPRWHEHDLTTTAAGPRRITLASSGTSTEQLFFTESTAGKLGSLQVDLSTGAAAIAEYSTPVRGPSSMSQLETTDGVTMGRDGNVWFGSSDAAMRFGLTGQAATVAPSAALYPASVNFGDQVVKIRSNAESLRIGNSGSGDLHFGTTTVSGPDASAFVITLNHCAGAFVFAGATQEFGCDLQIDFKPSALRSYTATLTVLTDAGSTPLSIPLSGTGRATNNFHDFRLGGSVPVEMTNDGRNVWFTEAGSASIGRWTPGKGLAEFRVTSIDPTNCAYPFPPAPSLSSECLGGITLGSDGNLWFTEKQPYLGRITPTGTITEFPTGDLFQPYALTTGSNGDLFLADNGSQDIREFSTNGSQVRTFWVPNPSNRYFVITSITSGPNGDIWATAATPTFGPPDEISGGDMVVELSPTAGTMSVFPIPTHTSAATSIIAVSSTSLWFAEPNLNQVGVVTVTGPGNATVTEIAVPTTGAKPYRLTLGSDGNVWLTEFAMSKVGRFTLTGVGCPQQCFHDFLLQHAYREPLGITSLGSSLWYTNFNPFGSSIGTGSVTQPAGS